MVEAHPLDLGLSVILLDFLLAYALKINSRILSLSGYYTYQQGHVQLLGASPIAYM